ncbi:MAG: HupE/UreJ family protein [Chitinophagaceae bacterium]|nr:MAG: HupE/UreJ family protein [Chitinophagaceae bacterium]
MHTIKIKVFLWLLLIQAFYSSAFAHLPDQSYIYLQIRENSVAGRFEITSKDLNKVFGLDLKPGFTKEAVAPHLAKIQEYMLQNASFGSGEEGNYNIRFTSTDILRAETFGDFFLLNFELEGVKNLPGKINVRYEAFINEIAGHTALLVIEENTNTGIANNESMYSLEFSPGNARQELSTTENFMMRSLWEMMKSGMWHIWIGFDHILFLLALLLPSVLKFGSGAGVVAGGTRRNVWIPVERLKPALINVVKIVTCFTIAHSITLCLAAFNIISLPPRLIESIIAISIALAAIHNIFPLFAGKEWLIAFVFGLFHGFGFASVLAERGLVGNYMALSIFGFNVGVEIGQLVIILLVFPILFLLRKTSMYPKVLVIGSIILILFSLYWFIERAFDVDFPVGRFVIKTLGL